MPFSLVQFAKFVQSAVTNAQVTIYTVPGATQATIKDIDITNTTAAAATVSINLVPTGGSAVTANLLAAAWSIPANSTVHWTGTQVLNAGDFISVISGTNNACNIMVSGLVST
jgi:hypothetical protein